MIDNESLILLANTYYDVTDLLGQDYQADRKHPLQLADVVRGEDDRLAKVQVTEGEIALSGMQALLKTISLDLKTNSRVRTLHNISVAAEIGGFAARDTIAALNRSNRDLPSAAAYGLRNLYDILQIKLEDALVIGQSSRPTHREAAASLARARGLIDS